MSKPLSSLAVGTLVRDSNTKYLGAAIVWKIAAQNHAGYPAGSTTLITEKCITTHMVDGKEPSNTDANRKTYGNNRWAHSNLRQWLNSSGTADAWYAAQHSADTPPTDANGYYTAFGYANEAGFLTNLSLFFRTNLLETTYPVELATVDGGGTETLTDKILLASTDEIGLGAGGAFPIFTSNAARVAYLTEEAVAYYNVEAVKAGLSATTTTAARYYWLRNAYASYSCYVRYVDTSGALSFGYAGYGFRGVRPLCNLNSSILVSDTPDGQGIYSIENIIDTAPKISGADTALGNIYGGLEYEYTVTDASEADTVTVVEKLGGTTIRTYTSVLGEATNFGLSRAAWLALSYGNHTATITATDTEAKTATRTLTFTKHQAAPTITGSDGSLGDVVGSLTYNYTVNDLNGVDGDTVNVVEKLNGTQKRSYTAALGVQTAFTINADDWADLPYGNHTIVITATDSYGLAATRTQAFVKRNYKPAISGTDTDIGTKTADFAHSYTIYDENFAEGDTVTVVEKLNGTIRRTYTLKTQTTSSFSVSGETFLRLANGLNTMEIEASDASGDKTTRTLTFTKQQDISVMLAEAIPNDGDQTQRPVEAIIVLDAYIPAGATISVKICNNGFDTTPTWEECTIEAVNAQKYTFTNSVKTALRWGVNIRVDIAKATASGTPSFTQALLKFKY